MAKYDWNTVRSYIAFLAGEMAPGTRRPHHDSELTSWYHDALLPQDHYHNNIVLFYHDSSITRSHFMDPTDRAIKGFYCTVLQTPIGKPEHVELFLSVALTVVMSEVQQDPQDGQQAGEQEEAFTLLVGLALAVHLHCVEGQHILTQTQHTATHTTFWTTEVRHWGMDKIVNIFKCDFC